MESHGEPAGVMGIVGKVFRPFAGAFSDRERASIMAIQGRFAGSACVFVLGLVGTLLASAARAESDEERQAIIKKVQHSVAKVIVEFKDGQGGHGSGYIIEKSGLIITNAHVIKGAQKAKRVYVTFPADEDKTEYKTEGFLDVLSTRDLALLRIDPGKKKMDQLKLATKLPFPGDTVFTFGSPLGFDNTPAFGRITSYRTGLEIAKIMGGIKAFEEGQGYSVKSTWVQHDACMSPGNSGGPLLNMKGEVLGLNTWHLPSGENMNFATSAANIKEFMAGASRNLKPWSQLPNWKGAGHDPQEAPPGIPGVTLTSWKSFCVAKLKLAEKTEAADSEIKKIGNLNPLAPRRFHNQRNQKLSSIYQNLAEAYSTYGAEARAAMKEMSHPDLIKLIISDAQANEQIAVQYKAFAKAVAEQGDTNAIEQEIVKIKMQTLVALRSQFDGVRANMGRTFGIPFPSLEEMEQLLSDLKSKKPKNGDDKNAKLEKAGKKPYRTWTSIGGGHTIRARLVKVTDGMAILETRQGKRITVAIDKLCDEDQEYIDEIANAAPSDNKDKDKDKDKGKDKNKNGDGDADS